jgi:hypothetical protein
MYKEFKKCKKKEKNGWKDITDYKANLECKWKQLCYTFIYFIFKQFICLNRIKGHDYQGPGGSLDTKICQILMFFASSVMLWH